MLQFSISYCLCLARLNLPGAVMHDGCAGSEKGVVIDMVLT